MLLQPNTVEIECQDGTTKAFTLSKFPAIAGREIITQYPLTAMPKIGDYKTNEELMLKVLSYVEVPAEGERPAIRLNTRALVDNHVPDYEALMRLEFAMIEYNCSFFQNGKAATLLQRFVASSQQFLTKTLTDLLPQLSAQAKQPSKS